MLLMSIELMINSANLVFLGAARKWGDVEGTLMPMFLIVVAAAEAAIGLSLILVLYRRRGTLDVEVLRGMKS